MIPTPIAFESNEEPPKDRNGRGIPFVGKRPVTTPMLKMASTPIDKVNPCARILPKKSGAFPAMLIPLKKISRKKNRIRSVPTRPNSSPTNAKIKSVPGSGRIPPPTQSCPRPRPAIPPAPSATSDWPSWVVADEAL